MAHLALARAALAHVDEVVFVLPAAFPHKQYEGAPFEARAEMLRLISEPEPAFSVAATRGGLFRAIASEFREVYGREARLSFLCGRDAAERIVHWDYGPDVSIDEMLREFDLLVAARRGEMEPPWQMRHAIERLYLPDNYDSVSSTDVRERIAAGAKWEHLTPEPVRKLAAGLYRPSNP